MYVLVVVSVNVGVASTVGVLVLALSNIAKADQPTGRYRDYRGALCYLRARYRPGDLVAAIGSQLMVWELRYYVPRLLPHIHVLVLPAQPPRKLLSRRAVQAALHARQTIWFVNSSSLFLPTPHPSGYAVTAKRTYVGHLSMGVFANLQVTRVQPSPREPARTAAVK